MTQNTAMTNDSLPALDDFICFSIYSANLAFHRAYKPFLTQLGLTYTQWIVMVCLFEQDKQTVKALGNRLFLASNTLTPLLKQLENAGLVVRNRDKNDERQVIICLTDKGRKLHGQACLADKSVFSHLNPSEIKALQHQINTLRDGLLKESENVVNVDKD